MITTVIIAIAAIVLLGCLAAGAVLLLQPSHKHGTALVAPTTFAEHIAEPLRSFDHRYVEERSLRDRELDEDATAIAAEFRRVRHERYLDSLRADAAQYFAGDKSPAKKATT